MKKSLRFFALPAIALFFLPTIVSGQVPQTFNYQGIARDASGNVLPNRKIGVGLSILDGGPAAVVVYQETFTDTTNAFGLFSMQVGGGAVVSGSFASINWATGNKYLQTAIDLTGGTNYALSGTTQLLSVPYALYAQKAVVGISAGYWSLDGNAVPADSNFKIGTTSPTPLVFEISNQFGGIIDPGTLNTFLGQGQVGANSSTSIPTGYCNTAMGVVALNENTGNVNVAIGGYALYSNTTGSQNVAIGGPALLQGQPNAPFALGTNQTGNANTGIGSGADVSVDGLSNATAIGFQAVVDASNKVRIGNSSVTAIEGQVPFTTPSDGRFKFNVRQDVKGLDFILRLRPVTYQFDTRMQEKFVRGAATVGASGHGATAGGLPIVYDEAMKVRRTGFIAQEVERAAKRAGFDFDGLRAPKTDKEYYSLSYASFVVPLVKAVQEQQATIEQQGATIARQQAIIEQQRSTEQEQGKQIADLKEQVSELRQLILASNKK